MAINPHDGFPRAGLAGSYKETIGARPDPLFTGDFPQVSAKTQKVAAGQDLAALSVVGLNANNELVEADNDAVQAIGVLPYPVSTASGETDVRAWVWRSGVFNPARLVWNAGYETDEDVIDAFDGAPTPTMILIAEPQAMSPA